MFSQDGFGFAGLRDIFRASDQVRDWHDEQMADICI